MNSPLKLLAVLAHPDDESFGVGGTFAKYSAEGVETYLICATRGERGRFGDQESPGLEIVGDTREKELIEASKILGIKEVSFLDYIDGDLDQVPPKEIINKIANKVREIRPDVVITFDPVGGYGHPDHIAISQFATGAVVEAAYDDDHVPSHKVSKLYYTAWGSKNWEVFTRAFKQLQSVVDGVTRVATPWHDWSITTRVDASPHWQQVWEAICCHKTQLSIYQKLETLTEKEHKQMWGMQEFYRAFSLVNGGRNIETDIFEGIN